ncbi:unnamed protein product [Meganyctiphanes norvegica]|uniref:Mitochondrial glycine transporter n=1 Tax=Meganyctiphanes norvegica TaxID=48144 RepID=A0AAV2QTZ8_MEGNR
MSREKTKNKKVDTLEVYSYKMALFDAISSSPVAKSFLAGSFSGTCSTILFQPLDLVKTRLQTATITIEPSCNSGMIATLGRVVKNERFLGLWKGMTPSIVRCVPGVGMYFSSLTYLKQNVCEHPGPLQAIALGVCARTFTTTTMIPITVIKARAESGVYRYSGVGGAFKTIYMKEGLKGLTLGIIPTVLRDAPFSGLYLMFYTQTKNKISRDYLEGPIGPSLHFTCGVIAGILASLVTQPFDVVKTKMQLYPDKFKSFPESTLMVYKKYGPAGYFKGLVPRMVRRTLMAAMAWTVYEKLMMRYSLK